MSFTRLARGCFFVVGRRQDAFEQRVEGLLQGGFHRAGFGFVDRLDLPADGFFLLALEPAKAGERIEFVGVFFLRQLHRLYGALLGQDEV